MAKYFPGKEKGKWLGVDIKEQEEWNDFEVLGVSN